MQKIRAEAARCALMTKAPRATICTTSLYGCHAAMSRRAAMPKAPRCTSAPALRIQFFDIALHTMRRFAIVLFCHYVDTLIC